MKLQILGNNQDMISLKDGGNNFNKEVDLSDYKVYLVGAFAENIYGAKIPTMDVDIVLRNEVKDYDKLKEILDTAMIIAVLKEIFIDIKGVMKHCGKNI